MPIFYARIFLISFILAATVSYALGGEPSPTQQLQGAINPQQQKLTLDEQKAQLEKQASDGLNMIKMGQLMVRNAQLEYDKLLATMATSPETKAPLAATKTK